MKCGGGNRGVRALWRRTFSCLRSGLLRFWVDELRESKKVNSWGKSEGLRDIGCENGRGSLGQTRKGRSSLFEVGKKMTAQRLVRKRKMPCKRQRNSQTGAGVGVGMVLFEKSYLLPCLGERMLFVDELSGVLSFGTVAGGMGDVEARVILVSLQIVWQFDVIEGNLAERARGEGEGTKRRRCFPFAVTHWGKVSALEVDGGTPHVNLPLFWSPLPSDERLVVGASDDCLAPRVAETLHKSGVQNFNPKGYIQNSSLCPALSVDLLRILTRRMHVLPSCDDGATTRNVDEMPPADRDFLLVGSVAKFI
ncbi:hypothetical protein DFJ77DRAFT_443075 [Powellomyces hirtus]|nr:hypothetical protein DFJ77DRAFT_443075 [Powellomyces hirtus]